MRDFKNVQLPMLILCGSALILACSDQNASKTPASQKEQVLVTDSVAPGADKVAIDNAPQIAVQDSCSVNANDFKTWFEGGVVVQDGTVTAADSLVPLDTSCDFYIWSWRNFLWQLSKTGTGYVFNSPPFFDLNGNNELIANVSGVAKVQRLRAGKNEDVDREGQAGLVSGVLMSQMTGAGTMSDGSLVYYAVHVNDVYAYMASGVNSGDLTSLSEFPTTAAERDAIVQYASSKYGVTIKDANALTMELKSSWVKVDPTAGLDRYITITADVPKYTQDSEALWTWDGVSMEQGVTLACVGYHLVGSTIDHPEMIWATFEHVNNAPNADFYYINEHGETVKKQNWNADGTPLRGGWMFMDGKSKEQSMNQMRMQLKGKNIVANDGQTIGPGNTMRTHPWGSIANQASAKNNTDIISLNQNITGMLMSDARQNYTLIGATWTSNGVPGVGMQLPVVVGSTTLANSTMETYFQYKNCFSCHKNGKINGLSHIFAAIKPLSVTAAQSGNHLE